MKTYKARINGVDGGHWIVESCKRHIEWEVEDGWGYVYSMEEIDGSCEFCLQEQAAATLERTEKEAQNV